MRASSAIGLGLLAVLGVSRPTLAQCPDGSPPPCRSAARPAPAPASNTIAVLYFDNLSRDSADTYLADGLTEELISRLAQVEALQVKSRTVVRQLRGRDDHDPASVGRSLGVAQLLSGSVLPSRGRVRVTVELTRVATGNTVWARSYDRPSDDLINVQAEIAESIAVNVGGRLAPSERQRIEQRPTRNGAAYDHLLRGRFETSRRTTLGFQRGIREYEEALRLDPNFTSALVGLSITNSVLGGIYYTPDLGMPRDSFFARSRAALARAFRQDSMSAEVLIARATSLERPGMNPIWLGRAVALDPRNADAHHAFALTMRIFGEDSTAIAEFKRAADIDPDRAISLENLGQTLVIAGRVREAARWLDSAVALQPEPAFYYFEQALARLQLGDTAGARASAELAANHGSKNNREETLAMIEARAGDSAAARARMRAVDSATAHLDCVASHECLEVSFTLASVGEQERALAVLERLKPVSPWVAYWVTRPEFAAIKNEPRYQRVLLESVAERERLRRNP